MGFLANRNVRLYGVELILNTRFTTSQGRERHSCFLTGSVGRDDGSVESLITPVLLHHNAGPAGPHHTGPRHLLPHPLSHRSKRLRTLTLGCRRGDRRSAIRRGPDVEQ
jgi:hypothetical protein